MIRIFITVLLGLALFYALGTLFIVPCAFGGESAIELLAMFMDINTASLIAMLAFCLIFATLMCWCWSLLSARVRMF